MLAAPPRTVRRLSLHATGGELFGIYVVNLFLTILTLGVYYFWGKTKVRRYLLSQVEFDGDRFEWHGTGKELLIGWLKAFFIFFLPLFLIAVGLGFLLQDNEIAGAIVAYLIYPIILIVIPVATVGSRRYRLSRTSWRGIRFSFRGRAKPFLKIYVAGALLTGLTIGLYAPFFWNNVRKYLVEHSYFGNVKFDYDGQGGELLGRVVRAFFISIITLGIYWVWFIAERQRYYWAHTSVATARFRSTMAGGPLFRVVLGNLALFIVTLGVATPWIVIRTLRFAFDNLYLEGDLDTAAIVQDAQAAGATGEGIAEFLDLDFFDFDLGV
ncbi:MAG: YjgN family protein [Armatimonadota bacterium]